MPVLSLRHARLQAPESSSRFTAIGSVPQFWPQQRGEFDARLEIQFCRRLTTQTIVDDNRYGDSDFPEYIMHDTPPARTGYRTGCTLPGPIKPSAKTRFFAQIVSLKTLKTPVESPPGWRFRRPKNSLRMAPRAVSLPASFQTF
jgi:hypothetical protein